MNESPESAAPEADPGREELLKQMEAYNTELKAVQTLLEQKDQEGLEQVFQQARAIRQTWHT